MESLFASELGKKEILNLYDQKLNSLKIDYKTITVPTSFGKTNIITSGKAENPPIILVHGSNGCAPIALETYIDLIPNFRIYAVDVLAQPNKSAETRLSMKNDSYGLWMNEILDSLQLDTAYMAGFSFGGLIILKTLEHNESRIKEVFLSSPVYIVNGNPIKALLKVFIPIKKYMKTKKISYVEQFLNVLFTDRDPFAIEFLSKVFLHFHMDFTPVPVIKTNKAKKIKTPITIFAAKKDLLFPGEKMIKRASKIFPSLKEIQLLQDSKHVQNRTDNKFINQIILKNCLNKTF